MPAAGRAARARRRGQVQRECRARWVPRGHASRAVADFEPVNAVEGIAARRRKHSGFDRAPAVQRRFVVSGTGSLHAVLRAERRPRGGLVRRSMPAAGLGIALHSRPGRSSGARRAIPTAARTLGTDVQDRQPPPPCPPLLPDRRLRGTGDRASSWPRSGIRVPGGRPRGGPMGSFVARPVQPARIGAPSLFGRAQRSASDRS